MSISKLTSNAARGAHMVRRGLLWAQARPAAGRILNDLARFEHPMAERLADALGAFPRVPERWRSAIEDERGRLLAQTTLLDGPPPVGPGDAGVTVGQACRASRRPEDAARLYTLARHLAPRRIVELGTNVGISSAYLAAAQADAKGGSLATLEASGARSAVARETHRRAGLTGVEYVVGLFEDVLDRALGEPVDFAFVDGHHQCEPTLRYFDRIHRCSTDHALFVFDDIRWSRGMIRAWRELQKDDRIVLAVDLCNLGIAVTTQHPGTRRRHVTPVLAL